MAATPIDIKTLTTKRLAAIRHVGPYSEIAPAFRELGNIAGPAGLFSAPDAMMVGVYHDDPTVVPAEKLRSAAGVAIGEDVALPAGLVEERLEGGSFACLIHTGSYKELPAAWRGAMEAVQSAGRKLRNAPSYEIYWNDPTQVPEAELKTEICIPIE